MTDLLRVIDAVYDDETIAAFTALHAMTSRVFGHCALCLFAPREEIPATRSVDFPAPIGTMHVCAAHYLQISRSPEC